MPIEWHVYGVKMPKQWHEADRQRSRMLLAMSNLNDEELTQFFNENPVMAERCRAAIETETKETEAENETPFPHAESI
jgi:hypothetical protein